MISVPPQEGTHPRAVDDGFLAVEVDELPEREGVTHQVGRGVFEPVIGRDDGPRRAVLLLQDLEFGGTQRHAVQLLRRLDRERLAPELWVLRGGDGMEPLAEATATPLRRFSSSPRWVTALVLVSLLRALRQAPPEILYLRAKVRGYGVPCSRVVVVPNGVDCSTFCPSPQLQSQDPESLFLGRLVVVKNPFTLLDAFAIVQRALPSARLRIVAAASGPPCASRLRPAPRRVPGRGPRGGAAAGAGLGARAQLEQRGLAEHRARGDGLRPAGGGDACRRRALSRP